MVRNWAVRIGEGAKYVELAEKGKFIAVGWNDLGDLSWLLKDREDDWERLLDLMEEHWEGSPTQISLWSGVLWRFIIEIDINDIILVPDTPNDRILIGKVTDDYHRLKSSNDGCPYLNRRSVEWLQEIDRDDLPEKLKRALNAAITVFNLDRHENAIRELLGEQVPKGDPKIVTGEKLRQALIDKLLDLSPEHFEKFIRSLLNAVGFDALRTQYVADKGVDIIGTMNAEGLANLELIVQVKQIKSSVGAPDVRNLRGALKEGQHATIITTGTFTKNALEEAHDEQKRPMVLINGEDLCDLILKYYDTLEDEYQKFLNLTRREIPIIEQFSMKMHDIF